MKRYASLTQHVSFFVCRVWRRGEPAPAAWTPRCRWSRHRMTATVHNTTQSHFISAFHCVADMSCDKLFVFKTLLQTARHIANRLLCRLGGLAVEKKKKK